MAGVATRPPPYAADTRAKGWRFELDAERIEQSDTWALASPPQRAWLLRLWMVAWMQTPCGSLPESDELIAVRLGMGLPEFQQNRAILLRGWYTANDGRLYHPVIADLVIEMMRRKAKETQRKADYRARLKASNVPQLSRGTDAGQIRDSDGSDDTGTGTSSKPTSNEVGSDQAGPDHGNPGARIPDCPHQEIIGLYAKHLPTLPQPRIWDGQRAENLRVRWRWVLTAKRSNGERHATDLPSGLSFFDRFFGYVAESDFLTGRNGKWQSCSLAWLVKAENFAKVLEGQYENREEAPV